MFTPEPVRAGEPPLAVGRRLPARDAAGGRLAPRPAVSLLLLLLFVGVKGQTTAHLALQACTFEKRLKVKQSNF